MPGGVTRSTLIAAPPALVHVEDATLAAFLTALSAPNFQTIADQKAIWAVAASNAGAGTAEASSGSSYVVSAAAYRRIVKGRNYS
jgi:ribosomal protein L12E/L44/L45/RPP1/RPP2